jgi:hypothetical protein
VSRRDERNHEPGAESTASSGEAAVVTGLVARPPSADANALLPLGLVEPDLVLANEGLRRLLAADVIPPIDEPVAYLGFANLLGRASTPAWLVDHVEAVGDLGLRLAALQGPHASPERCRAIFREVREAHPDLATVDIGSAAFIDEGDVLAALAVHPRTPRDVADEIVRTAPPRFVALVVGAIAGDPAVVLSAWQRLRDARDAHPDPWLRVKRALAAHGEAPEWLLCTLAGDDDERARAAVAARQGVSADLARMLHEDDDRRVLDALAANATLPAPRLRRFAWSHDQRDRHAVAANPSLDEADLLGLAQDDDPRVRTAAARNDRLPLEMAERLRDDPVAGVRQAVALHPERPFSVVAPLAADRSWRVRVAVAVHPGAPPALAQRLLEAGGARAALRAARGWVDPTTPALEVIVDKGFPELWSDMIERSELRESIRSRALAHVLACDPAARSVDPVGPNARSLAAIVYRFRGVAPSFGERASCAWRFTIGDLRRRLLGIPGP